MTDTLFTGTHWTPEKLNQMRLQRDWLAGQINEAEMALGLVKSLQQPFTATDDKVIEETLAAQIYDAYPKKQARGSGLAAIRKAMKKVAGLELLKHTQEYAAAVAAWPAAERQYVPMAATWFNQERWLDDRREWRRGAYLNLEPQIRGL